MSRPAKTAFSPSINRMEPHPHSPTPAQPYCSPSSHSSSSHDSAPSSPASSPPHRRDSPASSSELLHGLPSQCSPNICPKLYGTGSGMKPHLHSNKYSGVQGQVVHSSKCPRSAEPLVLSLALYGPLPSSAEPLLDSILACAYTVYEESWEECDGPLTFASPLEARQTSVSCIRVKFSSQLLFDKLPASAAAGEKRGRPSWLVLEVHFFDGVQSAPPPPPGCGKAVLRLALQPCQGDCPPSYDEETKEERAPTNSITLPFRYGQVTQYAEFYPLEPHMHWLHKLAWYVHLPFFLELRFSRHTLKNDRVTSTELWSAWIAFKTASWDKKASQAWDDKKRKAAVKGGAGLLLGTVHQLVRKEHGNDVKQLETLVDAQALRFNAGRRGAKKAIHYSRQSNASKADTRYLEASRRADDVLECTNPADLLQTDVDKWTHYILLKPERDWQPLQHVKEGEHTRSLATGWIKRWETESGDRNKTFEYYLFDKTAQDLPPEDVQWVYRGSTVYKVSGENPQVHVSDERTGDYVEEEEVVESAEGAPVSVGAEPWITEDEPSDEEEEGPILEMGQMTLNDQATVQSVSAPVAVALQEALQDEAARDSEDAER